MKNKAIITISFLALLMSFNSAIYAQEEDSTKTLQPIVRNNVYYHSSETGPFSLILEITKLKSDDGTVMLSLVDENGKQLAGTRIPIVDRKCATRIDSLPAGNYAVKYYHDKNDNGELDTGAFGIPNEGYGFSNDARGFMGPPDFADMIFKLEEDLTLKMKTVN